MSDGYDEQKVDDDDDDLMKNATSRQKSSKYLFENLVMVPKVL
jgi:hypothetical protein